MELEELLLRKEELVIFNENRFQVPIYPLLLRVDVEFDTMIASQMFPIAVKEWYDDLQSYIQNLSENTPDEKARKKWIKESYLDKSVEIVREHERQRLRFWEDLTHCDERGFVTCLDISRNAGGSLYLGDDFEREKWVFNRLVKFSEDKKRLYSINQNEGSTKMIMYSMHNVDYYPGALFLRNWAILYLNEALRKVDRQGKL